MLTHPNHTTQLHVLKHILCYQDCCCSVAKSCDSLWHHGLQHMRLPCPSLSPRVYPNSCPLSSTEQPTHWKRPQCGERLKAKGEEGGRGWDGWRASLIQWTWTWAIRISQDFFSQKKTNALWKFIHKWCLRCPRDLSISSIIRTFIPMVTVWIFILMYFS